MLQFLTGEERKNAKRTQFEKDSRQQTQDPRKGI
jgi:hypothetical protein